ncbi:MAG TPA: tetratricopeptide repeat protein [Edaphobacter sp.]|jgi:hypothetical protein|nr:tetratricopeptide repeat protein [Edaphobacter sp.]
MAINSTTRAFTIALLLSASCLAQSSPSQNQPPAPCPSSNQTSAKTPDKTQDQTAKPCTPPAPTAKKPTSAAEQFPFPGETTKPKNPPDSPTPSSTSPDSPSPTKTTPADAAAQHPFPTQPTPKLPGDDSSSSSSSSSNGDPNASPTDPDATPAPDPTANGDPSNPPEGTSVHRRLPKPKHVQSDDERVDDDLYVAKFYMNDENYQGAYLRAKDAVSIQPEYSATHFVLAQVLEKMKKNDEAIAEYQTYLKLDPEGEKAKAAKKALAELQQIKPGKQN